MYALQINVRKLVELEMLELSYYHEKMVNITHSIMVCIYVKKNNNSILFYCALLQRDSRCSIRLGILFFYKNIKEIFEIVVVSAH